MAQALHCREPIRRRRALVLAERTASARPGPGLVGRLGRGLLLVVLAIPGGANASSTVAQEPTLSFDALIGGDFRVARSPSAPDRLPWWRPRDLTEHAPVEPERAAIDGVTTPLGAALSRPLPAYEPLAHTLVVSGEVRGEGVVRLTGRGGTVAEGQVGSAPTSADDSFTPFEIPGSEFAERLGEDFAPRFELEFAARDAEREPPAWRALSARVELPLPGEAELRAEIVGELERIFGLWLERGLDDVGPRKTGLACHLWDVVDGRRLATKGASTHPFYELLRRAVVAEPRADWDAAFDRYFLDFLECCLHPVTGLPRAWNPTEDRPYEDRPVEIHKALELLVDVMEFGPRRHMQQALEGALRIADHVLEKGVAPDRTVAASFYSSSGDPNRDVSPLRSLDVPAQLARMGKLCDDWRYARAAREACVELEFENTWPGTWDGIDPGFDDLFGHFGARATTMWQAYPEDRVFRAIAAGGGEHHAGRWRGALRVGGNVAADQVRCWEIYRDVAELEPEFADEAAELLELAMRSHFQGEQYPGGAWGDVTIFRFDPKTNLQVGDLPGTPQNLLHGLGALYEGPTRTPLTRAMFTAVMRSSIAEYSRPFGMLTTRAETAGDDWNGGEIRFAVGLVEMLERL